ncbi:hypothetical protein DFH07DRAFT_846538 [Mycena maculata]|uniref:Uncharacterized protein n=1 Tax=Mycena maculata TaxID=230809 RepID=A0AAD7I2D2_9AGAR|nr:hypothetical protein DFH07DRAFT_846538 [Mycena maculata]
MGTDPNHIHNQPIWASFRTHVALDLFNKAQQLEDFTAAPWFPPGFPHEGSEIRQPVDWGEGGVRQCFQYSLKHIPPSAPYRSTKWVVHGKQRVPGTRHHSLGQVDFGALIYEPTEPLRDLLTDGKAMLSLMIDSVQSGRAIRLAPEVHPLIEPYSNVVVGYAERIVARYSQDGDPSSNLVHVFAERPVSRRVCASFNCPNLLPAAGPDQCLHHIITPPGN